MKKVFALLLVFILLISTIAMSASALSAYTKIEMTKDTKVIDDAKDQGANNQPIGWFGDCAIGCTWIGDMVELDDIDFGSVGASAITINFTNGDPQVSKIGLIIDDPKSEPVAIIECTQTAGWDKTKAKDFTAKIEKPITGKHTVYIKWINRSGSLFAVTFTEASAASTSAGGSEASPATGDISLIIAAASALGAFGLAAFAGRKADKK
jgi:hypothetical protein